MQDWCSMALIDGVYRACSTGVAWLSSSTKLEVHKSSSESLGTMQAAAIKLKID